MRSIFSNKYCLLLLFFSVSAISESAFGQSNTVNLAGQKKETKQFIRQLFNIYGNDLYKIHSKQSENTLSTNKKETVYFGNQKYAFSFSLTLSDNKLLFNKAQLDSIKDAYDGESSNLNRLFNHLELSNPRPARDSIKDLFLKPQNIVVSLYGDQTFTKRYYNRIWRKYQRPHRLTMGIFGGVNFSTAFVSPFQYSDDSELKAQNRQVNEEYLTSGVLGFSMGYAHRSHSVDLFFQRLEYGVKHTQPQQMDWNTGYYTGTSIDSLTKASISIPTGQWGIRYRYSNYYRTFSPYIIAGIHISYVNMHSKRSLLLKSQHLSTGCNLGLGLNIHPCYGWDIHIAPVANLSFNALKGTELQTRFSSVALEIGIRYNLALGSKNKSAIKSSTAGNTSTGKSSSEGSAKDNSNEGSSTKTKKIID